MDKNKYKKIYESTYLSFIISIKGVTNNCVGIGFFQRHGWLFQRIVKIISERVGSRNN